MEMEREIKYIKLDKDDILEILLEHFQDQFEDAEYAEGIILGTSEKELRFIGVFGNYDNDEIRNVNLEEVDRNMEYNGDHAYVKKHPELWIN